MITTIKILNSIWIRQFSLKLNTVLYLPLQDLMSKSCGNLLAITVILDKADSITDLSHLDPGIAKFIQESIIVSNAL